MGAVIKITQDSTLTESFEYVLDVLSNKIIKRHILPSFIFIKKNKKKYYPYHETYTMVELFPHTTILLYTHIYTAYPIYSTYRTLFYSLQQGTSTIINDYLSLPK